MSVFYKAAILGLISVIALLSNSCGKSEKKAENEVSAKQTESIVPARPVMYQTRDGLHGKLVNRNIFTDYQGKRIYFCCFISRDEFIKDPETFMTKFKTMGITLADSPSWSKDSTGRSR